jgi:hypothetical protein
MDASDFWGVVCLCFAVFFVTAINWDVNVYPYSWKYAEEVCKNNGGVEKFGEDSGGDVKAYCSNEAIFYTTTTDLYHKEKSNDSH